jgi:Ca2+-binding EF-hand superfamily protein
MLFKVADTNNDGQISQKEAIDAGNLLVGGFFFRADQNGDGVISPEEAKQARESLFAQQPLLRYILTKGKAEVAREAQQNNNPNATKDPVKAIGGLLDSNGDKNIQASEVRQAVQSTVQGVFAMADTNRDGQLSPTEINSAIIGTARTAAQAAFRQADTDNNGQISRAEFDKAIVEPANVVFGVLDANGDGQISEQEAQQARRIIAGQLRNLMVPEPANSARNLIRTGATPDQVAPVPAVAVPAPRR